MPNHVGLPKPQRAFGVPFQRISLMIPFQGYLFHVSVVSEGNLAHQTVYDRNEKRIASWMNNFQDLWNIFHRGRNSKHNESYVRWFSRISIYYTYWGKDKRPLSLNSPKKWHNHDFIHQDVKERAISAACSRKRIQICIWPSTRWYGWMIDPTFSRHVVPLKSICFTSYLEVMGI